MPKEVQHTYLLKEIQYIFIKKSLSCFSHTACNVSNMSQVISVQELSGLIKSCISSAAILFRDLTFFNFAEEKITSLSVSEYLKTEGRQTLQRFNDSLKQQIGSLKKKQIGERKKTWFYKSEKYRVTSTASVNVRKSKARVWPVENTTFTETELPSASPRLSSLESF